jgi:hypothetical protein
MDARARLDSENQILRLEASHLANDPHRLVDSAGGLMLSATRPPRHYASRYHSVQEGKTLHVAQNWAALVAGIAQGDPHDITTFGLVVLTLVPIAKVAFTLSYS